MTNLEWSGLFLAVTVVATIAIGHVMVRKINFLWGTKPAIPLILLGSSILLGSLFTKSDTFSSALGILGITTLWDGVEVLRQEKRVIQGHAPSNPNRSTKTKPKDHHR